MKHVEIEFNNFPSMNVSMHSEAFYPLILYRFRITFEFSSRIRVQYVPFIGINPTISEKSNRFNGHCGSLYFPCSPESVSRPMHAEGPAGFHSLAGFGFGCVLW